ncbi:MAG: hypothetical protein ABIK10_01770 [candidate division WOR-3 bacterium]
MDLVLELNESYQLDKSYLPQGISLPENRKGSQLAISMFCDIVNGVHPVEALLSANIDIVPKYRKRN